jgi:pimeloyl-ACP methyl ester carboxylesterase
MLSRAYWQPVIAQLAPDYACLSYDLRGFGTSQPTDPAPLLSHRQRAQHYSPAAYADDLAALLDRLGIETAWVIGHSLGGTIALWAAERHPHRIQGVVCVNSGGGIYIKEEFDRFRAVGRALVRWRPRWLSWLPPVHWAFCRESVARPVAMQWGRQRAIDFVAADGEAALWSLLESTTENQVHRLPQLVSQLTQPVYFLAGDRDTIMEPQYVRHLASFNPGFGTCGDNLIEIPDCGHLGPVEQPGAIAATIRDRLTCHAPALDDSPPNLAGSSAASLPPDRDAADEPSGFTGSASR